MLVYSSTCVLPSSGLSFHIRELDTVYLLSFGLRMCVLSCLLWDLALVLLILFAYRTVKSLQEMLILFT
jgi:hypothetical protein